MANVSKIVIKNLLFNEDYTRRIIPYIKADYFEAEEDRIIFEEIKNFLDKYNKLPTADAIRVSVNGRTINEKVAQKVETEIDSYSKQTKDANIDWLIDTTETFCQEQALYNALMNAIEIAKQKKGTLTKGAIPQLLSDALAVTFDPKVGHDYLEQWDDRFEYYHRIQEKLPFDLDFFNKITKGGLAKKTLNIILAGCVHPGTKVFARVQMENPVERYLLIAEIKTLMENGYVVEVDSPDGWVRVVDYVEKGIWEEFVLKVDGFPEVRCNQNHLFETTLGWYSALELIEKTVHFKTKHGLRKGKVLQTWGRIPIVDIIVDHPNGRYYTEEISSHNTGVGKSLFMCHVAASCLNQGKNVLYITLELAEEEVAKRIDANLLNITFDDLMSLSKEMYTKRVESLKKKTNGKLIVKEYPTAGANVLHFKALLNELRMKKNFKPDLIVVDYLNICSSSRIKPGGGVNSYTYIKSIAEELRGLAVEHDVPILSATQTTRTGHSSSDPELGDTSESFGLPATADFMFALVSTEQLESLNQLLVKQLKNRYNDPTINKRFVIGVDKSKMKLYDCEPTAQNNINDSGQKSETKIDIKPEPKSIDKSKFKGLKV